MLTQVFAALRSEGAGRSDIATELFVSEEELNEMVFGLVLNVVKMRAEEPRWVAAGAGNGSIAFG